MNRWPLPLLIVAGLAACAANPRPIVDTRGVDMVRYQQDLAECEAYREQVPAGQGVAKGAVAGAAVGAAVGAIGGNAGKGAAYGAVGGSAKSAQLADREKQQVAKNCMRGRGYKVLN
jgi:hypothetical protein